MGEERPKAARYEVRAESGGYIVWDALARRKAGATVYSDKAQAQSYANVRNEAAR